MEFVENHSRASCQSRFTRLTVVVISERSNWVSVSNPLANQLHELNEIPVVLQVRVLDAAGFPSKHPAHHVAWTGSVMDGPRTGVSGGATPGGSLGVPSALAAALGLRAGCQVQVAPLRGVPAAAVVEVEPVGESDWEVVEANAGFLEEQMLAQVSVLTRGQPFTVWARAGAAVRLRATSTQPADLVRLVPGCEVRVAPKPRGLLPADSLGARQGAGGLGPRQGVKVVVPLAGGGPTWSSGGCIGGGGGKGTASAFPVAAANGRGGWTEPWRPEGYPGAPQHPPQQHQAAPQQGRGNMGPGGYGAATPTANGGAATADAGSHPNGVSPFTQPAAAGAAAAAAAGGPGFAVPSFPYNNGGTKPHISHTFSNGHSGSSNGHGYGYGHGNAPQQPPMPGTAAAALAGVGLQGRPAWASGVSGPLSARLPSDGLQGSSGSPSVAAAVAAMTAAAAAGANAGGGGFTGAGEAFSPAAASADMAAPGSADGRAGGLFGLAAGSHWPTGPLPGPLEPQNQNLSGQGKPGQQQSSQEGRPELADGGAAAQGAASHGHSTPGAGNASVGIPQSLPHAAAAATTPAGPSREHSSRPTSGPPVHQPQPTATTTAAPPTATVAGTDHDRQQQTPLLQTSQPHLLRPHTHTHTQPHRPLPPQQLRLRVLDLPPARYLVPLQSAMRTLGLGSGNSGTHDGGMSEGASAGGRAAEGAAGPPPPEGLPAGVTVWLTLAVAAAPATAAALLGDTWAAAAPASVGRCGSGGCTALVRLHGRGKVRDLLGVLVPEPACPLGHVMLAPPLQHVLCVLPHMHVTVTALPPLAAVPAEPPALPSLKLHPLPAPAGRHGAPSSHRKHGNGAGGSVAAAATTAALPPPAAAAEDLHQYETSLAAAAEAAALSPGQAQTVSHAVQAWLAAQMGGILQATLAACGAGVDEAGDGVIGAESPVLPEVLLPLTSGTVVHFRLPNSIANGSTTSNGPCNHTAGSSAYNGNTNGSGGAVLPWPGPGDYCLLLHAVRRTRTSALHPTSQGPPPPPPPLPSSSPPVVSARMLAAMLGMAAEAAEPSASAAAAATRTGPPPLELPTSPHLGDPVMLPEVSYDSARHAAALALRPPAPPLPTAFDRANPPPDAAPTLEGTASAAPAETEPKAPTRPAAAAAGVYQATGQGESVSRPVVDLSHISWLSDHVERCLRRVLPQLDPRVSSAVARAGLPRCGGVLVTGPPGSGRSQLLAALGDLAERHPALQAHVLHVRCGQLAGGTHGATTSALGSLASEALRCAPCLLLLDDLDTLCPSAVDGPEYGMQHPEGAAAAARLADWLSSLLDELAAATAAALAEPEAGAAGQGGGGGQGGKAADGGWGSGGGGGGVPQLPAVAVVASANDAAGVHASLRRVGRLDFEVRLPVPGSAGRAAMLAAAARQRGVAVDGSQLAAVAGAAEGFEGVDLKLLLDRAVHTALRRQLTQQQQQLQQPSQPSSQQPPLQLPHLPSGPPHTSPPLPSPAPSPRLALAVTEADLRGALEGFVPAVFWGVQQAAAAGGKADGWEDVGGLPGVVSSLREALLLPVKYRSLVAGAPLRLRTGALLYGPPGCGKTHVVAAAVAAVAQVAPLRFLSVKGPELLNKYIGASEAAVRDLFARAAAAAPAVLFFDEFDAIAPPRGHDSTGVTDRVVNQLLTELDGVEGLRGVVVLAATSRPDLVDAALLRPGRLDRLLFCGPPEGPGQRLEILRALSRRLRLAPDVDLSKLAEATPGMTGADLGAVLSEAQLHAINETVEAAAATTPAAAGAGEKGRPSAAPAAQVLLAPSAGAPSGAAGGSGSTSGGGADRQALVATAAGPLSADPSANPASASASAAAPVVVGGVGPVICMRHLMRAVATARPSLPAAEAARLAALYTRFRQDREAPGARQQQQQQQQSQQQQQLARQEQQQQQQQPQQQVQEGFGALGGPGGLLADGVGDVGAGKRATLA